MKIIRYLCIVVVLVAHCSCISDDDYNKENTTPSGYTPVLLSRPDFESSVTIAPSQPIVNSGKIYIQGNFLFINELREGFHVLDNANPENPTPVAFIKVPGATDIAIRNEMLYVNQATDLLAMQYNSATNTVAITKRIPNIFPPLRSPDGFLPRTEEVVTNWIRNN